MTTPYTIYLINHVQIITKIYEICKEKSAPLGSADVIPLGQISPTSSKSSVFLCVVWMTYLTDLYDFVAVRQFTKHKSDTRW